MRTFHVVQSRPPLALVATCALSAFLAVTAISSGTAQDPDTAARRAELARLISARRDLVDDLSQEVADLRLQVAAQEAAATARSAAEAEIALEREQLAASAGTAPLRGRGVVVELAPSARSPLSADDASASRIHDRDLQLVVNALFAAGAEGVAINGLRLVATSPIRSAGETVTVNFRPLAPPYRVEAVGASLSAFNRSEIASRFVRWRDLFGLGFSASFADDLELPGYTGRVGIDNAEPLTGGSP